jgi:hypothetical protein
MKLLISSIELNNLLVNALFKVGLNPIRLSSKSERLNGKIQRFISNNYGIKDKDFALYRIKKYFE